jgi:protein subunit release factor A
MISHDDLKVETWPPPKPRSGQHVGSGPAGVKVTHIPTGIEACVEVARSQHDNRTIAIDMILAAVTHPRFR